MVRHKGVHETQGGVREDRRSVKVKKKQKKEAEEDIAKTTLLENYNVPIFFSSLVLNLLRPLADASLLDVLV